MPHTRLPFGLRTLDEAVNDLLVVTKLSHLDGKQTLIFLSDYSILYNVIL